MGLYGQKVLDQIIVLFIVMIAGFICKKTKIFDAKGSKMLSALLAYITNPCLIIASLQVERNMDLMVMAGKIMIISIIIHGALAVITHFAFGFIKKPEDRAVYSFSMMYGNCGFLGYPLMKAMLGDAGFFYGVIYTVPFNLYCWSHGVLVMNRDKGGKINIKKILLNPCLVAAVIGMILYVTNVRFPEQVTAGIDMIGDMTFPISMLIIGSLLADVKLGKIFTEWKLLVFSAVKLIVWPLVIIGLCYIGIQPLLGEELTLLVVTMAAVPVATNTAVLAELYDNNSALASKIVGVTTLLCLVTMPLLLTFTERIFGFGA